MKRVLLAGAALFTLTACQNMDALAPWIEQGNQAAKAAELISSRSPVALAVTLEAVRRAGTLTSLEDVLRQEFRTSCASLRSHDLVEGIRAQLIDKDRNPKWSPPSPEAVTTADVEAYFAPADPDLSFD